MYKNVHHSKEPLLLKEWDAFKYGKSRLRTWTIAPGTKSRSLEYKSIDDIRRERAQELRDLRMRELKISQSKLANAIHVSTRTLQGWEIGRSAMPEPILLLIRLLNEIPAVRRRLLQA